MKANVSVLRMAKRLRHRGKHLKAERAPQPDRRCIGYDYRVELHSAVTIRACLCKDITTKSPAYALVAPSRMDNESGIGDVRSRASVIGMSVGGADDPSVVIDGDNGAPW
jgi:hypothetical protein